MNKLLFLSLLLILTITCQRNKTNPSIPCEFIEGLVSTSEFQCGKIIVPENHDDPNGKKIQISYIVLYAKDTGSKAYPMIYLSGGPGGASLTAGRIDTWLKHPIREKRDIILLDQRGIGYSSGLPNMHVELYNIMAKDANEAEEQSMMKELIASYKQKCKDLNIQLQHYNTFQNAKDVGMLMKHLDYEKYNLYGVSYGTRLGRVIQDMNPDYLKTVILNSPNPIVGDLLIDRLKSYSLALERIFKYCEKDNNCHTEYPVLKEDYLSVINSLEQNPLEIDMDGKPFFVNAQDGVYFLRRKMYGEDSRTKVPSLIVEYQDGGGPIIKDLIANDFQSNYNFSMWLAVERYEMFNPENTSEVIEKIYETLPLLPVKLGFFSSVYLALEDWHDVSLSEDKKIFQMSSVPTMITVNHFDPVTPPENGHILMNKLTNGQLFILDEGGHGGGDVECRNKVMIAFMDDPDGNLDTSCLNIYEIDGPPTR
ncbi:MAG: alpha/beta fold hydrolase [Bacteroidetes bacterium]|nr:alpha/beta fold hydrolase [Bacteroidota bacterium]